MLAGTYLSEYGRHSRLSTLIRFINDVLLSAPSIIIGLFIYEIVVVKLGHFSAIAGALALGRARHPGHVENDRGHAEPRAHRHEGFLGGARRLPLAYHRQRPCILRRAAAS